MWNICFCTFRICGFSALKWYKRFDRIGKRKYWTRLIFADLIVESMRIQVVFDCGTSGLFFCRKRKVFERKQLNPKLESAFFILLVPMNFFSTITAWVFILATAVNLNILREAKKKNTKISSIVAYWTTFGLFSIIHIGVILCIGTERNIFLFHLAVRYPHKFSIVCVWNVNFFFSLGVHSFGDS